MNAADKTHTHDLTRGALERRVVDVCVRPFDQNTFIRHRACGRTNPWRIGVPGQVQGWQVGVDGCGASGAGAFKMCGIENSVTCIFRVECDRIKPARITICLIKFREHRLEIDVGRKALVALVEDVKIAVHIHDEEPVAVTRRIRWFRAEKTGSSQLVSKILVRPETADRATAPRDRQRGVIFQHHCCAAFENLEVGRISDVRPHRRNEGQRQHNLATGNQG